MVTQVDSAALRHLGARTLCKRVGGAGGAKAHHVSTQTGDSRQDLRLEHGSGIAPIPLQPFLRRARPPLNTIDG